MAYRATLHNKRITNTRHNDRAFDDERAAEARQAGNVYWQRGMKKGDAINFDETERAFYQLTFSKALEEQNERYIKSGHAERCKTIDDYRTSKQTCPEENLFYFGNSKEGSAPTVKMMQAFNDYQNWKRTRFPQVVALDFALHRDEKGADHIHAREVWVAKDKNGNYIVSQTKALEQMGIERPDPTQPKSRYNNPKMTYSAECRAKWIEIAKAYGLEIIEEPREASKSGLSMLEYQKQQAQAELEAIKAELEPLRAERAKLKGVDLMVREAYESQWDREHGQDEPIR